MDERPGAVRLAPLLLGRAQLEPELPLQERSVL